MFWARVFTIYYFAHFLVVMPSGRLVRNAAQGARLDHRGGARQQRKRQARRRTRSDGGSSMQRPEPMWRAAAVALLRVAGARRRGLANRAADEGGEEHAIERQDWTFGGFTGQYDKAQLQRGFQVYQQVCTACHGLKRVRFRNLAEPGGPEFPEAAVKALAVSGRTRSRASSTIRAIPSTGYPASPIPSSAPTRTTSRRARRRTARCRPTSRSSPRRAPSRATLPGTASGSRCCATWPPAIRRAAPTTSTRC